MILQAKRLQPQMPQIQSRQQPIREENGQAAVWFSFLQRGCGVKYSQSVMGGRTSRLLLNGIDRTGTDRASHATHSLNSPRPINSILCPLNHVAGALQLSLWKNKKKMQSNPQPKSTLNRDPNIAKAEHRNTAHARKPRFVQLPVAIASLHYPPR